MTVKDSRRVFIDRLDEHRGILVRVANAYSRNPADRDDLVQDIVVQLWRGHPRFDARVSFSTWAYRIAVNVAISFCRSQTRKKRDIVQTEPGAFDRLAAHEDEADDQLAQARALIDGLDELNRAPMILYLDDRSYAEIAEILGISETNVATKIARIKQKLKRAVTSPAANENGVHHGVGWSPAAAEPWLSLRCAASSGSTCTPPLRRAGSLETCSSVLP
jgi:RNA polymerase sigma factor (sigma-70 family)